MRLLLEDGDTRCNQDNQSEALAKVDDVDDAVVDLVGWLVVFCLAWLFVAGLVDGWFELLSVLFGDCCFC